MYYRIANEVIDNNDLIENNHLLTCRIGSIKLEKIHLMMLTLSLLGINAT